MWNEKGELAGGGYGMSMGGVFVTELQFSHEPNTSKIGFTVLNWHLAHWGFAFNDGKVMTPTCHDMGFRDISRADFLARLAAAERAPGKKRTLAGRGGCGGGCRVAGGDNRPIAGRFPRPGPIKARVAIQRPMRE